MLTQRVNLVRAERSEYVYAYTLLQAIGQLTAEKLALPVQYYDPKVHYDRVKDKWIGFGTGDDADKR